jgi:ABC-type polysaccharide/polyol phosphate transport system ATPase subunit
MEKIGVRALHVYKEYRMYPNRLRKLRGLLAPGGKGPEYTSFLALRDVSFEVPYGSVLGVIGRNGSGKSTLLRVLSGTSRQTRGVVEINGKITSLLELGAGFHPDFSGLQNIQVNASLLGLTKAEIESKLEQIIDFSGLGDFIKEPVRNYSSGMLMRLGFAIAIHVDAPIVLIDEVLAVGDLPFQKKCIGVLSLMRDQGKAIVMASHSLSDLGALCDQILYLDSGSVRAYGRTEEILQQYLQHTQELGQSISDDRLNPFGQDSIHRERLGKIRITQVRFLDRQGNERTEYETGEAMDIVIDYECDEPVENPLFRIQLFRSDGYWVYGNNTYRHDIDLGTVSGSGRVIARLGSLNLMGGDYFVSVGIWPDEYTSFVTERFYDLHEMAYKIRLRNQRIHGDGVAAIPCTWKIESRSG